MPVVSGQCIQMLTRAWFEAVEVIVRQKGEFIGKEGPTFRGVLSILASGKRSGPSVIPGPQRPGTGGTLG